MENFDKEFTGYMEACAENLAKEALHLKAFLEDKEESYILSNPEEVAHELIQAAMTAAYVIGAYNVLDGIRETGIVPRISFMEEVREKIAEDLIKRLQRHKYVDIGVGAECAYCVNREQFNRAVSYLQNLGYVVTHLSLKSKNNPDEKRCTVKLLSQKPISDEDVEDHIDEWLAHRYELMGLKMQRDVLNNMERYHLNDFDPCLYKDENLIISCIDRRNELDFCSRLIAAMARNGATELEIEGIVKYSMVVLDAEKKRLNWKRAAEDFRVDEMNKKYYDPKIAAET